MKFNAFYIIDPRPELATWLTGRVEAEFAELLMEPLLVSNPEGGCHSMWHDTDYALTVKLLFLAGLREYDLLETDAGYEAVLGSSRISIALFDRWWTLRKIDWTEATEAQQPHLVKHFNSVERTGNELVDSWLDWVRDHGNR